MKKLTLEMSLKPFKQTDDEYVTKVCTKVFRMWKPLCDKAETVSIMLWAADGSEILDYKGNLDEKFEWAYFIGGANPLEGEKPDLDPDGTGLHSRNYLYIPNPPIMTYGTLKRIISAIKRVGGEILEGKPILVGATFDPGPEFAKSDFKYNRHNEICMGNDMGNATMVCAYATLHCDDVHYAGFPQGIPEGLPFGTFLGRQSKIFMDDMGYDYLWLSNGLGFGRETWSTIGAVFDGVNFDVCAMESIKKDVFDFWKLFRHECPDYPVETRGTNMSMGIDLATDGVPLREIYKDGFNLLPPPNSPWAALNGDFGLEIMGHMSRIAELPDDDYMFRYYIHDVWWVNSPWYDRYNGQPHDIYMPLSVARINEEGRIVPPSHLNILSIDNSFGDMPEACVYEPLPHLLKALKELPDEPSPLVWVYQFDEYSDCKSAFETQKMFFGDWFIRGAINNGFPLSTVVSSKNFCKNDKSIYESSILVSDIPQKDTEFECEIINYVNEGGRVIFYGNPQNASKNFRQLIGVECTDSEVSGELEMRIDGKLCGKIKHTPLLCCGGISTEAIGDCVFAEAEGKAVATACGNAVWVRGTCSCDFVKGSQILVPHSEKEYFIGETLMLKALERLGYKISFDKKNGVMAPVIMLSRHNNAYMFSVYSPSTTVKTGIRFPFGAPVLDGYETAIEDGCATYHFPKAEHRECRVFVEQDGGTVSCRECPPVSAEYRRRIKVSGLENATVRFLAESYCREDVSAVLNSIPDFYAVGDEFESGYVTIEGRLFFEARNVSGEMVFSLRYK